LIFVGDSEPCRLPAGVSVAVTSNFFILRSLNLPIDDMRGGLAVEFGGFRRRDRR
jgi:hypothetical protein